MPIDRKTFFGNIRDPLFGGSLGREQVSGIGTILNEYEARQGSDARHLAYMLGTAYHETAKTMQPIKEYGGDTYFHDRYDIGGKHPDIARDLGNLNPGDGVKFCGRGFIQLTGRNNYARAMAKTGADLIGNPSAALHTDLAAKIMFDGMSEGWFTGKNLSQYFDKDSDDPVNARRIINGLDKAPLIAGYHSTFLGALKAAGA